LKFFYYYQYLDHALYYRPYLTSCREQSERLMVQIDVARTINLDLKMKHFQLNLMP
jgi:hypothetical protein